MCLMNTRVQKSVLSRAGADFDTARARDVC